MKKFIQNNLAMIIVILVLITICLMAAYSHASDSQNIESLHRAILKQEGWKGKPGDGGKALGPYQIWHSYWLDATEFDKTIGGKYEDVNNLKYARKVFDAYMRRYATVKRLGRVATWEDIARIHNGGPNGYKKSATDKYWNGVKSYLE